MGTLKIRLFGHLELSYEDQTLSKFPTRKARGLFAFLAVHASRLHSRERLSALFWPKSTESAARKRLRTELWHTRQFLAAVEDGDRVILTDHGDVGINPAADVWVDRMAFEEMLGTVERDRCLTPARARQLARAVETYRGPLLEGCYDDWCLEERRYLEERWISALEKLMAFHQQRRDWPEAIHYGSEVLRRDPLAEHVHRGLMRCHFEQRNRTAALRQYRRCVDALARELDVEPMPETVELCRQIRACQA
ncbi:MAG: BTAD domain-containing putative transcriptional regulator [Acidobacteriota bacterium]